MKSQNTIFSDSLPNSIGDSFYVNGFFIKTYSEKNTLSVRKKDTVYKGIGGTVRVSNIQWFNTEDYIRSLQLLLFSLKDTSGNSYFKSSQIDTILHREQLVDEDRGEEAIYWRSLIYYWLQKTGVYITDAFYIGHVKNDNSHSLVKHCLLVKSFLRKNTKGFLRIQRNSHETFVFDKFFKTSENILLEDVNVILRDLYTGKTNDHKILFNEFMKYI